jgi:hypothetical protein
MQISNRLSQRRNCDFIHYLRYCAGVVDMQWKPDGFRDAEKSAWDRKK